MALIALSLSFVPVSSAGALTCRVPQDEATVQDAIDNANCAVIKLGTGTYTEIVQAGNRSFTLVGKGMNNTILSGGDAGRTLDINGANKVVIRNLTIADGITQSGGSALSALTEELTLKRVKIANSEVNYTGVPAIATGAGMYAAGQIKMTDSIVTGNEFQGDEIGYGGGIYVTGAESKLTLVNSKVFKNIGSVGGGIYSQSEVILRNSTIQENAVADYEFGGGGGIVVKYGKLSISDSTIKGNTAFAPAPEGGGIALYMDNARLSLVRSLVVGNKAPDGGGIYVGEGKATIKNSTIRKNHSAPGFGGGVFVEDKTTIKNSTLSGSTAADGGGAIEDFGSNGSLTLINSTLSDNHAEQYGGGIDAYLGSSATLTNVTFTNNSAGAPGGGFHFDGDDSDYKIKNVISAGNSTGSFGPDCDGTFVSLGGNVIGDPEGCGNLDHPSDVFKNPKLGPLASNGGPTNTHALKPGSPAIGRGRPGCPGLDQRGAPRDDCDSGAYERVKCEGALVAIIGTGGKDKLKGTNGPDGILGLGGKDRLVGRGAGDGLCGGNGNDRLLGGGGNDSLDGEDGNDTCIGGSGNDEAKACETERTI